MFIKLINPILFKLVYAITYTNRGENLNITYLESNNIEKNCQISLMCDDNAKLYDKYNRLININHYQNIIYEYLPTEVIS